MLSSPFDAAAAARRNGQLHAKENAAAKKIGLWVIFFEDGGDDDDADADSDADGDGR